MSVGLKISNNLNDNEQPMGPPFFQEMFMFYDLTHSFNSTLSHVDDEIQQDEG